MELAVRYFAGEPGISSALHIWGVFVWKEFARVERSTERLLTLMFAFFFAGLNYVVFAPVVKFQRLVCKVRQMCC